MSGIVQGSLNLASNSAGADLRPNAIITKLINMAVGILLTNTLYHQDITSLPEELLEDGSQLNCSFNVPCYWYNQGNGRIPWKMVSALPPTFTLLSFTNALPLPKEAPFIFISVSSTGQMDVLLSAPILCQNGNAAFIFKYWKTAEAHFQVCTTDIDGEGFTQCQNVDSAGVVYGTAKVHVPPMKDPFRLAVVPQGEGFLAIDDIAYYSSSGPCQWEEVTTTTRTTTIPTTVTDQVPFSSEKGIFPFERRNRTFINAADELNCDDFLGGRFACRWGGDQIHIIASYFGETRQPDDPIFFIMDQFAYFGDICRLVVPTSTVATASTARTTTTTTTTTTAPSTVPVTEPQFTNPPWIWGPLTSHTWSTWSPVKVVTSLPPKSGVHQFTEVTKPRNKITAQPTFLLTSTRRSIFSSKVTKPNREIIDKTEESRKIDGWGRQKVCRVLQCDFDSDMCGYGQAAVVSDGLAKSAFWRRIYGPFGRPLSRLTDIRPEPHTHYYMATLLRPDRLHNIAVLESPYFTSAKVAFLHFSVYSASASVDVKVCFDSARENRPRTAVNENIRHLGSFVRCRTVHQGYDKGSDGGLRRWNNYRMLLVPGFVKFYIMAEHTGLANDYAVVGIDRIYVTPCESN